MNFNQEAELQAYLEKKFCLKNLKGNYLPPVETLKKALQEFINDQITDKEISLVALTDLVHTDNRSRLRCTCCPLKEGDLRQTVAV